MAHDHGVHVRDAKRGGHFSNYIPLIVLVVVSGLAAYAITVGFYGIVDMSHVMHAYMGVFLTIFAMLKLFDLKGFENGFAMYDLLAKRVHAYGYVYPFIELALGLFYLAYFVPDFTYRATIVVFAFGALGVVRALRQGLDIACPCMGNILKVPLSTVTLTEDLFMIVMAIALIEG